MSSRAPLPWKIQQVPVGSPWWERQTLQDLTGRLLEQMQGPYLHDHVQNVSQPMLRSVPGTLLLMVAGTIQAGDAKLRVAVADFDSSSKLWKA